PEMIEIAKKNSIFSDIIKNAELVVPDSAGIELALRLKGVKQQRIPGIDLAKKIISFCNELNYPVALIGAAEEVIQTVQKNLKTEFEKLNICYAQNGYFTDTEEDTIINNLAKMRPKFVLIALGAPKQELFIKKCREKLHNAVYIGVGGSFDVWSGKVERAPEFFKNIRCEWLYRTFKQPERLKRIYKTLPMFLFKAIIEGVQEKLMRVRDCK
ncbi:MAG: WecB/TagA/CpsF family glycosyltransferase, partial [Candidatus Gastranaerophilales bacterium]|nr:WecB/TagA/CpsF family glycosyltransferase [Candidatus Gastranaerophilales bacterium]